jgi:hypothetical protein
MSLSFLPRYLLDDTLVYNIGTLVQFGTWRRNIKNGKIWCSSAIQRRSASKPIGRTVSNAVMRVLGR